MGTTCWSDDHYNRRTSARLASGTPTFHYSHTTHATVPRDKWKAHATLDPKGVAIRESRDSDEHPESLGIIVGFDQTGSMGVFPQEMQADLKRLMSLLLQKDYATDPQIMFAGIGDAYSDEVPLQVGQFESGIEMEDNLSNLFLEHGGGGTKEESYDLLLLFAARHTAMDCFEKRGKKGYLFLVGDEMPYPHVDPNVVRKIMGPGIEAPIPIETIIEEASKTFHVFYVLAVTDSYGEDWTRRIDARWKELLGQRVLHLDKPDAISTTIALAIGQMEGRVTLASGLDDLKALSTDTDIVAATERALSDLDVAPGDDGAMVAASVASSGAPSGVTRL